jgi:saposin
LSDEFVQLQTCSICTFIGAELEHILADSDTEAEITEKVEAVCSYLPNFPSTLVADCDQFMEDNIPAIMKALSAGIHPNDICAELHMCPAKKEAVPTSSIAIPAAKLHVNDVTGGELCQVCKLVIEDLDQVLAANATKEDIENALDKICTGLPSMVGETCNELVDEYAPQIIDLAANVLDADYVCKHLGVCAARKPALLGANPCSYGPSYWCNDKQSAQDCNAVTFCMQHYW